MIWRNISPPSSGLQDKPRKKSAEAEPSSPSASAGFLLSLFFDPEDGGSMFL
jgi:hypothetical protein